MNRGFDPTIAPAGGVDLGSVACVQCANARWSARSAPFTGWDHTERVWAALADPDKHVVVQTAPAIRVSIGEEMGLEPGAVTTGQMVAALRRPGFDKVFDTDFSADPTIMEGRPRTAGTLGKRRNPADDYIL